MNKDNLLLVFIKNPVAGKVKTRLAKDIGDIKAAEVYKFLLKYSQETTAPLKIKKQVHYSDRITENDIWSDGDFEKKVQMEGDLGKRMEFAFSEGFEEGYKKIIIIGSDLYDIQTTDIEEAFEKLNSHDYVIGPAEDGGYYLLGMKQMNEEIFDGIAWSTKDVFEATLQKMQDGNVKVLELRNDIDTLNDIKDLPAFQKFI